MKKAMLFVVALLFSVGVNAATLSMSGAGSSFDQDVDVSNGSVVLGGGTVSEGPGTWFSYFDVSTDSDTAVKIEWSFNPTSSLAGATLRFYNGVEEKLFNITGDFSFTAMIYQGYTAWVDIKDATRNVFKYDVSVSAVPVPAALFLFAPALLGFLGLRRKTAVAA
ncbi:MAG TPA: hypothetical protein EYM37_08870 [Methylophaga aminisulfidivorans]|uniref:VPLPA-CTERM protein sorting domain-containing protein n=1 Tax=Methylophaga thalassica TaxID=40223 RepID=A0ABQ5TTY3_9GAMM|nr:MULTISPECIES: hypothetical protein [Methylophaga]GLP99629.1 hypothetical protein GCM10007891_14830 [Methylophaga thalassica]HIC45593.1 hypothetical protein [Methylophaga sp.]HIM40034.1 hypothetical protein [Methylophaga aminisulfidivorans]